MKNLIIIVGTIMLGVIIVNTMILGDNDTSLKSAAGRLVSQSAATIDSLGAGE